MVLSANATGLEIVSNTIDGSFVVFTGSNVRIDGNHALGNNWVMNKYTTNGASVVGQPFVVRNNYFEKTFGDWTNSNAGSCLRIFGVGIQVVNNYFTRFTWSSIGVERASISHYIAKNLVVRYNDSSINAINTSIDSDSTMIYLDATGAATNNTIVGNYFDQRWVGIHDGAY